METTATGTSTVEVRELDRTDRQAVHRFWEVSVAAVAERPYAFPSPWEAAWLAISTERPDLGLILLGGYVDGEMWGAASIALPRHDNTHQAWLELEVHPDRRRQRLGSALLERAGEVARREGRRLFLAEVFTPPGESSPGLEFAQASGFTVGLETEAKVADLPETEHLWQPLAEQVAPHMDGYRLVSFQDGMPEELIEGYCLLAESFLEEAPVGEVEWERERWDPQRVREHEDTMRRTHRKEFGTIAVGPNGEVAGFTELRVNLHDTSRAFQGGTLVHPAHRGHRLGLALKLANHRAVRAAHPNLRLVVTGNAGVNAHMNAVNDRLGFKVVERCIEMQRTV